MDEDENKKENNAEKLNEINDNEENQETNQIESLKEKYGYNLESKF